MRIRTLAILFFTTALFSFSAQAHAETVILYSQLDDSGEMVSQQATFQNTWITSASLGNLVLGKDRLTITFTMKDPSASNAYHQPEGIVLGTCATCQNLQKYYFTDEDRILLSDGMFHPFTVQTGTTTIGLVDGETPIYITFFGLSQYHNSTHLKSNAAGTIPYLVIEGTPPPPVVIPEAPPGSVTVYTQNDNTGVMTNQQATFQNAHIDSASLGNLNFGQAKLYITFTMKDPNANNAYHQPEGVALGTCSGCRDLQTYRFTDADRALLSDQAFHTFMVETGTTTSTYADGTRPVFISFFNLPQYQYGTKIKSNVAATIPYLTIKTAPPPDPCAAPGACASNVLFLPGIEASRLYRPDYAGGTDKLWEPNADSDVQDLYMNPDGSSARHDVYAKDVIDEAYGTFNIYKSFLADLDAWKNADHIITDYRAIPYDWRLSLDDILAYGNDRQGRLYYSGDLRATSTPYIIQELRRLAATSKTGRVTIVAHSNGGLVAKALTDKLGSEASNLIDKILFVAVPQVGTPQAVGAVLHGYNQGIPRDWAGFFLSPETARTLAKNMPSAYNLLPSFQYFTYTQDPVITFDNSAFLALWRAKYGDEIHSSERLRNFLTDVSRPFLPIAESIKNPIAGNAVLLADAETLHNTALDAWTPPPGVLLYEIAGWGEDTLATIEYYEGKETVCAVPSTSTCPYYITLPTLMYTPKEVVEGDGTVVVPSALWTTASTTAAKYWVNLKEYDTVFNYERKHADILEVPSLRTLIQNILTNSTSTAPLAFIATVQPATDAVADKRLRFILHSPLNLSATDNLGNIVNYATSTIPGARWKRYGEVQVLSVPQNTLLTLNLDGYASGSFTLDMQEIDGNNVVTASSSFAAIPSATSTTATMSFTDGTLQGASPLFVDYDGNGTTDFSLESKIGETTVFDITPPEARIAFSASTHKLLVEGVDNLSSTTVFTTATSSLITDEAGNTLQIIFKQFTQEEDELKLEIQELRYNGARGAIFPRTVLEYEWSADRSGTLKELEEKATIGMLSAEGAYNAKKNVTKIVQKTKGGKGSKQILPGLVIIGLATDAGKINVNY